MKGTKPMTMEGTRPLRGWVPSLLLLFDFNQSSFKQRTDNKFALTPIFSSTPLPR